VPIFLLPPWPNIGMAQLLSKASGRSQGPPAGVVEKPGFPSQFSKFWLFPCRFLYLIA